MSRYALETIVEKLQLIKFLETTYWKIPHVFDEAFGDMAKKDIADMVDNLIEREIDEFIQRESA